MSDGKQQKPPTPLEDRVAYLEGQIAELSRRLAAAERRQAQTIEAISAELVANGKDFDARLKALEGAGKEGRPSPHGLAMPDDFKP